MTVQSKKYNKKNNEVKKLKKKLKRATDTDSDDSAGSSSKKQKVTMASTLLLFYSYRTIQIIHVWASLPYSLAFVLPSPSCAASRCVLLRLYCHLRINC